MSFYTSLTGLDAATAQLSVTSNNIANAGTTGFKRSVANFADIFATSPLQKASSTVGQGVALKQVSQVFSQGNISVSSNTLDMAITGDGFFPMRSADGLQQTYTRNGSFMLNEQYNVVNSSGERLMAATVDSTGSANINDQVVLTIPQKTSGEAKQTTQVNLGLNFPSDATVITTPFNRNNPSTYNKSTAFTVYDASGNGYLATVYYVKTSNANATVPTNTWQTYVFVGSDQVNASLQQATDANGSKLYVNQYGQLAPYSQVKDQLTTAKTMLFSLNDLTNKQTSVAASVTGTSVDPTAFDFSNGINFKTSIVGDPAKAGDPSPLANMFQINVDGSKTPVSIDLSYLKNVDKPITGSDIAAQVTAQLQQKFGGQSYFDISDANNAKFNVIDSGMATTSQNSQGVTISTDHPIAIDLTQMPGYGNTTGVGPTVDPKQVTVDQMTAEIQQQLNYGTYVNQQTATITATDTTLVANATKGDATAKASLQSKLDLAIAALKASPAYLKMNATDQATAVAAANSAPAATIIAYDVTNIPSYSQYLAGKDSAGNTINPVTSPIKASYDYSTSTFQFLDGSNPISLNTTQAKNDLFQLTQSQVALNTSGESSAQIIPNGQPIRPLSDQRYGMSMTYDSVNKTFSLHSGTTGDASSLSITGVAPNSLASQMFGLAADTSPAQYDANGVLTAAAVPASANVVNTSSVALRGISSSPAVAVGTTPLKNISNNFAVDATNNTFIVTVDGVSGTVVIPTRSDYSLDTFKAALQKGINAMGSNSSNGAPTTVNGVTVGYDSANGRFTFTDGMTGANSYVKISGSADWGLDQVQAARGSDSTWIKPTQHTDIVSGVSEPKFIDSQGLETTSGDGFTTLPKWSPVFLTKGQLTFSTAGKLVSPIQGTQLEPVYLAGGKGVLTINVNYAASTQYTSPFAVLSQSQDGTPEGDLVGVTIGNDGLVSASFSNGTQQSLAKILLANFSSPTGLRQMGDSTFLASGASGPAVLGTAGSAGLGTISAGSLESSNVDLTQELVELITEQRNFQANSKAIETETTMTSAIINMRS